MHTTMKFFSRVPINITVKKNYLYIHFPGKTQKSCDCEL